MGYMIIIVLLSYHIYMVGRGQALFTQRGYISESLTALAQRMETEGCDAVAHGDVAGGAGSTWVKITS